MDQQQKEIVSNYLKEFQNSAQIANEGQEQHYAELDRAREEAIPFIRDVLEQFLAGEIPLEEFKERNEALSREYSLWGYKGFSGQMQLNQFVNNIPDDQRDTVLKEALRLPETLSEAVEKISALETYLQGQKQQAENPKSIPRVNQAFLLTYFWEMQYPEKWPVYFSASKKVLEEAGFSLEESATAGEKYQDFVEVINTVQEYIGAEKLDAKRPVWYVEHVLWHHFVNESKNETRTKETTASTKGKKVSDKPELFEWVPTIVRDLPALAANEATAWSEQKGVKPERAFEIKLHHAFTLLGYHVEELGQGKGREPDGVAISIGVDDGDYAVVFDAKAREQGYALGTQDREIAEYINTKATELRKKRVHKVYFVVVSSDFNNPEKIKSTLLTLYKKTQKPVTLLTASDLLFVIEEKLRNVELDHSHLEDLFLETGLITREKIAEVLGAR